MKPFLGILCLAAGIVTVALLTAGGVYLDEAYTLRQSRSRYFVAVDDGPNTALVRLDSSGGIRMVRDISEATEFRDSDSAERLAKRVDPSAKAYVLQLCHNNQVIKIRGAP